MLTNLPTLLTLLRIVMLPVIVVVFYLDYPWARPTAACIFFLAAITDWLDGFLARRWNQESRFIIGREITISALREWMAEMGQRGRVAVGWLGKVKTTLQMLALGLLLYLHDFSGLPTYKIGMVALYVAAILTIWSMFDYLRAAFYPEDDSAEPTNTEEGA